MKPLHIFFFRGLSTEGQDSARFSALDFGPVYRHFAREFSAMGANFYPVLGMGAGPLAEVAARARAQVEAHPAWQDPSLPVHFLGHSAGGLVARLVLEKMDERVRAAKVASLLTIATPHRGSLLARICLDMPESYRGSTLFLRSIGYDIRNKRGFFTELTPAGIRDVLAAPEAPPLVPSASIVASVPRADWCAPLKMFYLVKAFNEFNLPSDGIVEKDTQPYGKVLSEIKLDHFRQAGFFGDRPGFQQLCATAKDFFAHSC